MMENKEAIERAIEGARKNKPGIIIPRDDIYNAIFEAGYDKALAQLADMTEECKQVGRRGVVSDIVGMMGCRYKPETFVLKVCDYCEAQLKKGGLEK